MKEIEVRMLGRLDLVTAEHEEWRVNYCSQMTRVTRLAKRFGCVCKWKLKVNVRKSKVMRCTRQTGDRMNAGLNAEGLE